MKNSRNGEIIPKDVLIKPPSSDFSSSIHHPSGSFLRFFNNSSKLFLVDFEIFHVGWRQMFNQSFIIIALRGFSPGFIVKQLDGAEIMWDYRDNWMINKFIKNAL